MNANELADALDDVVANYIQMIADVDFSDVATMLRQQQAEIEALKMDIHSLTYGERLTKYFNEPVAWTDGKGNYFDKNSFFPVDDLIPLYTNPTELTDEEILEVAKKMGWRGALGFLIDFARAILRKAQEK